MHFYQSEAQRYLLHFSFPETYIIWVYNKWNKFIIILSFFNIQNNLQHFHDDLKEIRKNVCNWHQLIFFQIVTMLLKQHFCFSSLMDVQSLSAYRQRRYTTSLVAISSPLFINCQSDIQPMVIKTQQDS